MYPDSENLKQVQANVGRAYNLNDANTSGPCGQATTASPYRRPSLQEESEKRAAHHLDEHVKAQSAASFLSAHPEFDEFIRLIRSGALQI